MKILFVSRYVDPEPIGSNRNVFLQALGLKDKFNMDVSILTWPYKDLWNGPMPKRTLPLPALSCERSGLTYHVMTAPNSWNELAGGDSLGEEDWDAAVKYGEQLLSNIAPDIVHLQHRHGLWWILDSAQRLGIKTVYTNHDWGVACLRTGLIRGDHTLCDAVVEASRCAVCIKTGRGRMGALNEKLVSHDVGVFLFDVAKRLGLGDMIKRYEIVTRPAISRTEDNIARVARVISNLNHLVTPSYFGKRFYSQFGLDSAAITVLPWYCDPLTKQPSDCILIDRPFTMTYVGRLSPEKGVHQIFEALENLDDVSPIAFRIAGAVDSGYAKQLKEKYPTKVGQHSIQWLGWMEVDSVYKSTDVSIIPSLSMDNTPLSLVESIAYGVPVIAARIEPIAELLVENSTGFMADYGSVSSLRDAIRRASQMKTEIRSKQIMFPPVMSSEQYLGQIVEIYRALMRA